KQTLFAKARRKGRDVSVTFSRDSDCPKAWGGSGHEYHALRDPMDQKLRRPWSVSRGVPRRRHLYTAWARHLPCRGDQDGRWRGEAVPLRGDFATPLVPRHTDEQDWPPHLVQGPPVAGCPWRADPTGRPDVPQPRLANSTPDIWPQRVRRD